MLAMVVPFSPRTAWSAAEEPAHVEGHHALDHANPSASIEDPAEIKWDLAIWSAVVFLLLMAILYKFAWGPISEALDRRENAIAENIAAAENAGAEAKKLIGEYEAKLAGAADEVRLLLEEARRDAEATKQQVLAEAKQGAQQERQRTLREIDTATDQALKLIAETSANMAVDLAGKIIRKQLSAGDHKELIKEAVDRFPSRN
jgi:F-type H+-transporting ATPase subunit b